MIYRVFKSGPDGICGGASRLFLQDVLKEINYFRGWESRQRLHEAIKGWAKSAQAGDSFATAASVIVFCRAEGFGKLECPECLSDRLECGELEPTEDDTVEQVTTCLDCGERWKDVFVHSERQALAKSS